MIRDDFFRLVGSRVMVPSPADGSVTQNRLTVENFVANNEPSDLLLGVYIAEVRSDESVWLKAASRGCATDKVVERIAAVTIRSHRLNAWSLDFLGWWYFISELPATSEYS